MPYSIPEEVNAVWQRLIAAGFESYLIGGCVRNLLLHKKPKDWDIATAATPDQILKLFPDASFEVGFGTVCVKTESEEESLRIVEVTPFRIEGKYSDKRHPDTVAFAKTLAEDVSRRDFTINALAMNTEGEVIDLVGGQNDLAEKTIRTVGDPTERFAEDPLRLLRAVRLSVELDFAIDVKTHEAIAKHAHLIRYVSKERVRDEFARILMSAGAPIGVDLMTRLQLTKEIIPELAHCAGVGQNKHHIYDVYEHSLRSLAYAVENNFPLELRLAALLHDIAKPHTKSGEGPDATFYQHQYLGERMTRSILSRLRFSAETVDKATFLVRHHMFYYNVDEVTEAGVRRFLSRVGIDNIDDLIKLRQADRIGSGVPKAQPYRLRHLLFMIEKVRRDPVMPKMLAIGGNEVMTLLGISPGPIVGHVLKVLLEEVLEDPGRNNPEYLSERVRALGTLKEEELRKLAGEASKKVLEFEKGEEAEMKRKHRV